MGLKTTLISLPAPFLKEPMNPPLGLAYIGAALKNAGHEVDVIDYAVLGYDYEKKDYLKEVKMGSHIYGVYCATAQFKWLKEVCKHIKKFGGFVVVGGPHATARPEDCLNVAEANLAIRGEGEKAITDLAKGVPFRDIPGACYSVGRGYVVNDRAYITKLDNLPQPDLSLFDLNKYKRKLGGERAIHITTLRGCPYNCHFCNGQIVGRNVRYHSVEYVMGHIDNLIAEYGIKNFYIYDDIFTLRSKRLKQFCEEFKKRDIKWRCWTRADLLKEDDLKAMKESGLESIAMGIESGSDTILRNINKGSTVEESRKALLLCKRLGVPVRCSLMFSNPGESSQTLEKTVALMRETQPDEWSLSVLVPTPGSEFWDNPEKYGMWFDRDTIAYNDYQELTRCGDSGMGNLFIHLDTIPFHKIKGVLGRFVKDLEEACPRKKIRDTVQELKVEEL